MNLISQILQKKRDTSSFALIPFLTIGYPSINTTVDLLFTLDKKGADIIELGIPYSDALADGYLIQNASKVALQNGIYIDQIIKVLNNVVNKVHAPIIIFTYYNPILVRGLSRFIKEISEAGVKGLVIPDLPIEEADYVLKLCVIHNLELILFIAPTSSKDRIINILSKSQGCVYLVSSTGVTGIREMIGNNLEIVSKYIRGTTNKFTMLGFGISSPLQVSKLLKSNANIDAIVVGSAFTRIIADTSYKGNDFMIQEVGSFCERMKSSVII